MWQVGVLLGTGERGGKEIEGLRHMSYQRRSRQRGGLMERSGNGGKRSSCGIGAGQQCMGEVRTQGTQQPSSRGNGIYVVGNMDKMEGARNGTGGKVYKGAGRDKGVGGGDTREKKVKGDEKQEQGRLILIIN